MSKKLCKDLIMFWNYMWARDGDEIEIKVQ